MSMKKWVFGGFITKIYLDVYFLVFIKSCALIDWVLIN